MATAVSTLTASIDTKQNKFLVAEIPANSGRLFDNNSTKFRAINVDSPLIITTLNFDYLTISCDSYTKAQANDNLALKAPLDSPTFTGSLTVSGANDHTTQSIRNTQLNGFSSLYIEAKSGASAREVAQIFCGQNTGL